MNTPFCLSKLAAVIAAHICAAAMLVLTACAQTPKADSASDGIAVSPEIFTRKVGNLEVSMLSERQQQGSPQILIGATKEMLEKTAPDGSFPNAVNAFVIKKYDSDGKVVDVCLVDTGFGTKLFSNLEKLNIKPEDVSSIFLTHMHGDHIGGLLREDGTLAFKSARLYVNRWEYLYWRELADGKETPQNKILMAYWGTTGLSFGGHNEPSEDPSLRDQYYLSKVPKNAKSNKVSDYLFEVYAYGHTPGHTAYLVYSEGERLLIWGDLTHAMAVQMPYPQVSVTYDVDPVKAAKARREILEFVAKYKIPVAGMHIAYPGMGIVTKDKENPDGFKFEAFKPRQAATAAP